MNLSDQIKNNITVMNYKLAQDNGIEQKSSYEIQPTNGSHAVVRDGEVIAEFLHEDAANKFIDELKSNDDE